MFKEYFLDANAHLPLNAKAAKAYTDFYLSKAGHGHPSSPSIPGRLAGGILEDARTKIASLIGAKNSNQIIFTNSCTQACEWGLQILFSTPTEPLIGAASSPIEHPAVREPFQELASEALSYVNLSVTKDGIVKPSDAEKLVVIHTQNEIGVIQDLNTFKCKTLFSDMSQSLGKIPVNVSELNVDIAVFGAHKFGGPGNFGFIYLKDSSKWKPFGTGSRYFLDRPGTPDIASAVACAVALEEAISTLETRTQNMLAFQSVLETGLEKLGFEIIGKKANRSPGTTFVYMPEKGLRNVFSLGEAGIYTGLGSACGSIHTGDSPLASALGIEGGIHDFMRISQFGDYNDKDAEYFLTKLQKGL